MERLHAILDKASSRRCKDAYACTSDGPHSHHLTFIGRVRYCGLRSVFAVR